MRAAALGMVLLCGIAQGAEPKTVTNTIGMELVSIPKGKFLMGGGSRAVAVILTKPFLLGKTEVTQGQFKKVMDKEPWLNQPNIQTGEDNAASCVTWDDATAFCQKLTDTDHTNGKLPAGESYRLPTQAEWEYACRAGTTTKYSFGRDGLEMGNYGWYTDNTFGDDEAYAHAVGLKQPNRWGLYDMHGNVSEWCSDGHDKKFKGGTDPVGPQGSDLWCRGGDWADRPDSCQSNASFGHTRNEFVARSVRLNGLGFRVARSQSAQ